MLSVTSSIIISNIAYSPIFHTLLLLLLTSLFTTWMCIVHYIIIVLEWSVVINCFRSHNADSDKRKNASQFALLTPYPCGAGFSDPSAWRETQACVCPVPPAPFGPPCSWVASAEWPGHTPWSRAGRMPVHRRDRLTQTAKGVQNCAYSCFLLLCWIMNDDCLHWHKLQYFVSRVARGQVYMIAMKWKDKLKPKRVPTYVNTCNLYEFPAPGPVGLQQKLALTCFRSKDVTVFGSNIWYPVLGVNSFIPSFASIRWAIFLKEGSLLVWNPNPVNLYKQCVWCPQSAKKNTV